MKKKAKAAARAKRQFERAVADYESGVASARRSRRRARIVLGCIALAVLLFGIAVIAVPNLTSHPKDRSATISLSIEPSDPGLWTYGILGDNITFTVREERDFLQQIGLAERSPYIRVEARFTIPMRDATAAAEAADSLSWTVNVKPGVTAFRTLDQAVTLENGDETRSMGDWRLEDTVTSFKIDSINRHAVDDSGADRLVVVLGLDVRVEPPVASQSMTDGRWLQSWMLEIPAGDKPIEWLHIDTSVPQWWEASEPAQPIVAGGVQLSVCPECDIVDGYADADEFSRDTFGTIELAGERQTIEVSTAWRPWAALDAAIWWLGGTVVAIALGLLATWLVPLPTAAPTLINEKRAATRR